MNVNLPLNVFNDVLIIVNNYGAFLRERELLKQFKNSISGLTQSAASNLSFYEDDPYSWESREFGVTTGLTSSEMKNIKSDFERSLTNEYQRKVKSRISSEKYYKKLKHQFNEKHPEYKDELAKIIKEHQVVFENNRRQQHKVLQDLLQHSLSFISFFRHIASITSGDKMIFDEAFSQLKRDYDLQFDKDEQYKSYVKLFDVSDYSNSKALELTPKQLKLEHVDYIATILKEVVEKIPMEKINSLYNLDEIPEPTEKDILKNEAAKSVQVKFKKYHKLYKDYLELRPKIDVLI